MTEQPKSEPLSEQASPKDQPKDTELSEKELENVTGGKRVDIGGEAERR
jgi:bacteriocin-like protein